MPRWSPDGRERLVAAAIDLFRERGYEAVTITDITERAGLTRRSYFRHFPDKREVLFPDSRQNMMAVTHEVAAYPPRASAREAVLAALTQVGHYLLRDVRAQSQRQNLIDESPELQERERTKLAEMAAAVAEGLIRRGLSRDDAHTCAVVSVEIFRSAYLRAIRRGDSETFDDELDESLLVVSRFVSGA
jgi:AcrR family transcriptional regulator